MLFVTVTNNLESFPYLRVFSFCTELNPFRGELWLFSTLVGESINWGHKNAEEDYLKDKEY